MSHVSRQPVQRLLSRKPAPVQGGRNVHPHCLHGLSRRTVQRQPKPGRSSVAALSGALGAALISMVCHLTLDDPAYESVHVEIAQMLTLMTVLRKRLIGLAEEDARITAWLIPVIHELKRSTGVEREALHRPGTGRFGLRDRDTARHPRSMLPAPGVRSSPRRDRQRDSAERHGDGRCGRRCRAFPVRRSRSGSISRRSRTTPTCRHQPIGRKSYAPANAISATRSLWIFIGAYELASRAGRSSSSHST